MEGKNLTTEVYSMNSPLYKVDPLPKFFLVICISVLAFMFSNIPLQIGLLALVLTMARLGNISAKALWSYIKSFAYLVIVMVIAQSFFWPFPKTFLIHIPTGVPLIGGLSAISLEGLYFGVYVALRFLIIVTVATVFSLTTNSRDFLLSLVRIKIPFEVSFMVNIAVRFVPMITDEAGEVTLAQKARGLELEKGGVVQKLRALLPMLLPLKGAGDGHSHGGPRLPLQEGANYHESPKDEQERLGHLRRNPRSNHHHYRSLPLSPLKNYALP